MAFMLSSAPSLPVLQPLHSSSSSPPHRRLVWFLHPCRSCHQAFRHSPSSSRRRNRYFLTPCCCFSDSDDEPPKYTDSPLLYRLWLRRHPPPKKIYASEFDINYDIYATNSMAGYEAPPPPLVEFDAPWEEYYDELVGDDYIDPNAKPTSSLIKYLEELNEKMVQDDLKAGKPPRKKFPNKDLNLKYDEGPRFLKPRGQVSRYFPAPPVMAPLDWVCQGGVSPYIKLPPIVFPKKEDDAASSEASGTNGKAIAEVESGTMNGVSLSTQGSSVTNQEPVVGPSSSCVQEVQPTSPRSGVSPVVPAQIISRPLPSNPTVHEPYQHSVGNILPPEAANQSICEPYQPYQSTNENGPVQGHQHSQFVAKGNKTQENHQYQPSLLDHTVSQSPSMQEPLGLVSINQISSVHHQESPSAMPTQPKEVLGSCFDFSRPPSQQDMLVDTVQDSFGPQMGDTKGGSLPVTEVRQSTSPPEVHSQQNTRPSFPDSGYDSPRLPYPPGNLHLSSSVQPFQGTRQDNVPTVDSRIGSLYLPNGPGISFPQAGPLGESSTMQQPPSNGALSSGVQPFQGISSGDLMCRFYAPKVGDTVVGAVVSGDDYKLDLEVGGHQPAMIAFRDFQLLIQVDSEDGNFTIPPNKHTAASFVAPVGRSLLVKEDDVTSENIETGTVFVADVQATLDETTILSCRSLVRRFAWCRIKQLMQIGEPIEIEIMQSNEGGLSGYFEGVRAFLPRSELVQRPENTVSLRSYIGRMLRVAIIQADEAVSNLVISEVKYWMHKNIRLGVVHDVTVTRVHPYGVQMEIQNTRIRGFLHVSNMSKEYVRSVTELFQEGESARVIVTRGRNPQMVSFSLAELESEPGLIFHDKTHVYKEADEMARRFCQGLSEEERQIFPLPTLSGFATSEPPSLDIANLQWVRIGC